MRFRSRFGLIVLVAALLLIPLATRFFAVDTDLSGSAVRQEVPVDSGDEADSEPVVDDGGSDADSQESESSDEESSNESSEEESAADDPDTSSGSSANTSSAGNNPPPVNNNRTVADDDAADSEDTESADDETTDSEDVDSADDEESTDDDTADSEDTESADDETTADEEESDQAEATEEADSSSGSGEDTAEATEEADSDDAAPEATEEPEPIETLAPEVTEEPDFEATAEAGPESPRLGITSAVCVPGTGVAFVITNGGGDMSDSHDYAIDGADAGSFRLGAGDHVEIQAGYGDPVLTSGDIEASLGSLCNAPGRIAGFVWENVNGDDVRDEGEPGIADVTVTLTGAEASEPMTTVTLEDGSYSFELLMDGTYTVTVDIETLPPRLLPSYDLDEERDSETMIIIEDGLEVLADFGYTLEPPGAISGVIWDDQNGDGARDEGEPGIAGIELSLTADGEAVASLTTDESGLYAFAEIIAGQYTLTVLNAPEDAQITADPDGDLDGSTLVGVRPGATTEDVNFGYRLKQPGAISGVVWADLNGDGERGENEPGLSGAIISLSDSEISVTSAEDGSYLIEALDEGEYTINVDVNALLFDYLAPENPAITVTVTVGETTEAVNFGILPRPVSIISGTVWADLNGDGLIDEDETGIAGIHVSLSSSAGESLADAVTDDSGLYSFGDLRSGLYLVSVDAIEGWLPTADIDGQADSSTAIMVEEGTDYMADFGAMPEPRASIAGVVWSDANSDGAIDEDETGLVGLNITLTDAEGAALTVVTDDSGAYGFTDLAAGDYTISVVDVPDDYQPTTGSDSAVTVASGDAVEDVNFGYLLPPMSAVSGVVWVDSDADGLRGEAEAGLDGITVNALDAEGTILAQVVTAADGSYAIAGLRLGETIISLSDVPGGLAATFDADGELDGSTTVSLTEDDAQADFGYQALTSSSISGMVWLETENFGIRDRSEKGLAGTIVRLLDSAGDEISAVNLEADGRFEFAELEPGLYTLEVDASALPSKLFATYDRDGELDFKTTISLRPGEALRDVEFGIVGTF